MEFWIKDGNWLKYGVKRELFLEYGYDYDNVLDFFLDNQPDLSVVYDDLIPLLDASEQAIVKHIRENYPEIWNYKVEETQMELKKIEENLTGVVVAMNALSEAVNSRIDDLQEVIDRMVANKDCGCTECESILVEDKPTISLNKGDVVHGLTGEPIGVAVDNSLATLKWDDTSWVGTGTFSTALPYVRSDVNYIGGTSSFTQDRLNAEDSKPTNQPSEVVYVFRAKPDSQLHAKLIELLLEWEDDYDLFGSEVSYVFE